jgi:hypothetical protein
MADSLVYLYAVGDGSLADEPELAAVTGVGGAPVRLVVSGGLAAVVSPVDTERFGAEALRGSLEDLRWLEGMARAHDAVVAAVGLRGPIAPVRLATIYVDEANVRTLLDEHAERFAAALDEVRGRTEWGVKAFSALAADDVPDPATPANAESLRPGAAYLQRKRDASAHAAEGRRRVGESAEELHRRLAERSVASRRYPAQDPRLSGRRDEMALNAAYLVADSRVDDFRRAVADWDAAVIRPELTGPWAPYSFAVLEQA